MARSRAWQRSSRAERAEGTRNAAEIVLQGAEPGFGPPEHFGRMQRDEYAELGALIKAIGMRAQ
jgi:hypothetical protein